MNSKIFSCNNLKDSCTFQKETIIIVSFTENPLRALRLCEKVKNLSNNYSNIFLLVCIFIICSFSIVLANEPQLEKFTKLDSTHFLPSILDSTQKDSLFTLMKKATFRYQIKNNLTCSIKLYEGLIADLPLAVTLANILAGKDWTISVKDNIYYADDHSGVKGEFVCLYQDTNRIIYYGKGKFKKALVVRGSGCALLDLHYLPSDTSGVLGIGYFYLKIDATISGLLMRGMSHLPIIGNIIDDYAISKVTKFLFATNIVLDYLIPEKREETLKKLEKKLSLEEYNKLLELLKEPYNAN